MSQIIVQVPQDADGSCPDVVVQFVPYFAPVLPPPVSPPPPPPPPPPPVSPPPPPPPPQTDDYAGALAPGESMTPPADA